MRRKEIESPAETRELVVGVLRDPAGLLALPPGRMDLALRLLHRARLSGRIAWHLRDQGLLDQLEPVVSDFLTSALVGAESRARAASWEMDRIAWALEDMPEVPIVALKGCAYLLSGTPNARGRIFSDVDLLVPEADLGRVERRLSELGWASKPLSEYDERYYRQWAHEIPPLRHLERDVEVDLHHNILMRTARLKPSAELLLADAREVPGTRFKVLAPVDMLLHAMTHLFYGGEMDDELRELVDIDDLLRHFTELEPGFWEQFDTRAAALDLTRPKFYGLRYAALVLGTPVPDRVLSAGRAAAPSPFAISIMDWLVSSALIPQHSDTRRSGTKVARTALYLRSHWVKMPPVMLVRHVWRKLAARRLD